MSTAERIWLSPPHMGEQELEFVLDAFRSNWIAPLGPHLQQFESELSEYTGSPHVAGLSCGTAAIHLALKLLGVSRDDEVLVPSLTFIASANPVVYDGAVPVFLDSERETWNLDPQLLEEAILDGIARGKKPKAVIVVHLYGMPAKLREITEICTRYEIPIIEDAAEALGSEYEGRRLGTFGTFGVLSFNGNKIITTSGGGALLSADAEAITRARFLATQARDDAPHYEHSVIGYNYRLSNVLAAIGRGQLAVLQDRVNQRRKVFEYYRARLGPRQEISFVEEPAGMFSNRWLSTIIFSEKRKGVAERVRQALAAENIESRPLWKPLHLQPVFRGIRVFGGNVAADLFSRGLCLPSGSALTEQALERICDIIGREF